VIKGGGGQDTLFGGADNDIFLFNKAPGVAASDTIADFTPGEDLIRLDNDFFTALITAPGAALETSEFRASSNGLATQASEHILYNTSTGELFYDSDGSGSSAPQIFATLTGAPTLGGGDLFVVA